MSRDLFYGYIKAEKEIDALPPGLEKTMVKQTLAVGFDLLIRGETKTPFLVLRATRIKINKLLTKQQ
jgi:hypothetical protein